jgi:hypothetical protein
MTAPVTTGFTLFMAPQKFSAAVTALRALVRHLTTMKPAGVPLPSIWMFTEVASAARAAALNIDGCTLTHKGGPGEGECAILTRDERWTVKEQHWFKLTDGGGAARLAHPIYAPCVVLEGPQGHTVIATTAHLPAHIEGIWAAIVRRDPRILSRSALRNPVIRTWVEAVKAWRKHVEALQAKYPNADVAAFADFNVNIKRKWVSRLAANVWPGLNIAATQHGDLGLRTIGWGLTSMHMAAGRVYDQAPASDHKAGRYTLEKVHADPKPPPPPAPDPFPKVYPAIAAAKRQSATGIPHHGDGECLMAVRECYGFPAGVPDAIASWVMSAHKHPQTDPDRIPRGVPVYWSGGSAGHGHIAISNGDGTCWSTDIKRVGFFDRTPIAQIHDQWGLTLLGWSEEVNGRTVPDIGPIPN